MFKKIIIESIQSHKDLQNFAKDIIDMQIAQIVQNIDDNLNYFNEDDLSIFDFLEDLEITYDNMLNKQKYSEEFLSTLKKSYNLYIYFRPKEKDGVDGQYNNSGRKIYLYYNHPNNLKKMLEENWADTWRSFLLSRMDALIHELQHWYDSIRSLKLGTSKNIYNKIKRNQDGKPILSNQFNYLQTKNSYKFWTKYQSDSDTKNGRIAYLKQPSEINARFAELVHNLEYTRLSSSQDAVEYLKNNFAGWKYISPTMQQKLIKKIVELYGNKYFNRNRMSKIDNFLTKYEEKRRNYGDEIETYITSTSLIIDRLKSKKQLLVIKQLIKIANYYNLKLQVPNNAITLSSKTMSELGFELNDDGNEYVK